eukprot:1247247-Rhodomonas_salina.2
MVHRDLCWTPAASLASALTCCTTVLTLVPLIVHNTHKWCYTLCLMCADQALFDYTSEVPFPHHDPGTRNSVKTTTTAFNIGTQFPKDAGESLHPQFLRVLTVTWRAPIKRNCIQDELNLSRTQGKKFGTRSSDFSIATNCIPRPERSC